MAGSIKDQLMALGLSGSKNKKPEEAPRKTQIEKPKQARADDISLAQAYSMRAQHERAEKERAEKQAQELARRKKERQEKIARLLQDQALNRPDAEQQRYFEYGNKIRCIYVTEAQLVELNHGEIGIVQWKGRYVLVSKAIAAQVAEIEPRHLALLVDPAETDSGN